MDPVGIFIFLFLITLMVIEARNRGFFETKESSVASEVQEDITTICDPDNYE